jgi:KDO2-lipid IV(A) lauroyltransferase
MANICQSDLAPGRRDARRLVRSAFVVVGQSALECVVLPRQHDRLLGAGGRVRFAGDSFEVLTAALKEGRGVLYVTAHFGNWELMAAAVARVAPVSVLFKPSYDPRFTRMIVRFRERSRVRGIDVTAPGHVRQVVQSLRRGEVVGILMDQPVQGGIPVPFLGRTALTSPLAGALAGRTGAAVVAGFIRRESPCHHAITIERLPLEEGAGAVDGASHATLAVEKVVRATPEQWLWSLDRWRSPLPTGLSSTPA